MAITTLKLTKEHFVELLKKGFSLDHIFILTLIKEGHDISFLLEDNMKLDAMHQGLVRRGLVNEDNKLTLLGHELLDFLQTKMTTKTVVKRKAANATEFDEWWECFPSTDHFEFKGRVFTGSRGMKTKKEECALKFNEIVNDNVYTARQIINATKFVVNLKKEASYRKKSNELTYLQNSYTFLKDGHFKPFVEMAEKGIKITGEDAQTTYGPVDI